MNYLKLKGEIVLLDNILHAEIKENTIEILYGINVPEQGNKFYGHVLDYSEVKNDVNEEKTKIEQDYDKLMYCLNVKDIQVINKQKYYENLEELEKEVERNRHYSFIIYKLRDILGRSGINKIKRIKEVLENDV